MRGKKEMENTKLYFYEISFGFGGFGFVASARGADYVKSLLPRAYTSLKVVCDVENKAQARKAADDWQATHSIIRGASAKINWR